jgi:hypothetical protein
MRPTPVAASWLLVPVGLLAAASQALPQAPARPVQVKIEQEKLQVTEPAVPVDPQQHIVYGVNQMGSFGFLVDGNRITYGRDGNTNHTVVRIDNQIILLGQGPGQWVTREAPLGNGPFGKKRNGTKSIWVHDKIRITQSLEIVPSKVPAKSPPGTKRRLDACVIRYDIENTDERPHTVGIRTMLDMLIVNNDGALFASPTTHPNQILNGVELKDKAVPEYLQVLQIPNLQNPGFVAHFTFKLGSRLIGPDRVVMTNLGAGFGQWDIPAQMAGDSAIGVFFSPRQIKGRGKVELAYAYGQGIASNPENEGKVTLALGGSFAPGKLFDVTAYIDEPVEGQTLTLELPAGMELVEGRGVQPVPAPPADRATSVVLWKARVLKTGRFAMKIHSSNGVTYTRTVTISAPQAGANARRGDAGAALTRP